MALRLQNFAMGVVVSALAYGLTFKEVRLTMNQHCLRLFSGVSPIEVAYMSHPLSVLLSPR
jgi:hypothetical protein